MIKELQENINSEETVTIPKSQLEGILADIQRLKDKDSFKRPKRVTERTALLRFHNDKPVVNYFNVREKKDKDTGKLVSWMDIELYEGEEKKNSVETVEYLAFLNSPNSIKVDIKYQKVEEVRESGGTFRAINPDEAKVASKTWVSKEVEAEVIRKIYTATVVVTEGSHQGEEYVVDANAALNK